MNSVPIHVNNPEGGLFRLSVNRVAALKGSYLGRRGACGTRVYETVSFRRLKLDEDQAIRRWRMSKLDGRTGFDDTLDSDLTDGTPTVLTRKVDLFVPRPRHVSQRQDQEDYGTNDAG
jgi:hypothetical protein